MTHAYLRRRDRSRVEDPVNPRPPKWAALNMSWAAAVWRVADSCSLRRRLFKVKILYDKHNHGGNLSKLGNPEIDTRCPLCGSEVDGHQHIIRECTHPLMVAARRRAERQILLAVCAAEGRQDSMARVFRGYYNMAVDRRGDAHELWTGVLTESTLQDLDGLTLVAGGPL